MRFLRVLRWAAIALAVNVALNFVLAHVLGVPVLAVVV